MAPGVARLNDANLLMLRVVARQIDPSLGQAVTDQAKRLQQAVIGQGDLHEQSRAMQVLADQTAQRIEAAQLSNASLRAIAMGLVDEGLSGDYQDYAGAEQALMSISSVIDYMNRVGLIQVTSPVNQQLKRLNALLLNDERFRPADFQAGLSDLRGVLARAEVR
jgi:hypothetical protein